jgi:Co/Zn/Cd efflux system component
MPALPDPSLRRAVLAVCLLNLGYFGIEFGMALAIGSVSLFADSVDFLEDTLVNFLVLVALSWAPRARARAGMALAGLILVPGIATLATAVHRFLHPAVPDPVRLGWTGAGALLINAVCAWLLARHRHRGGSLAKGAFLSARNDVLADAAIIAAGFVTYALRSPWPDLIVGLGIAAMNADAAREVWEAAREEGREPDP